MTDTADKITSLPALYLGARRLHERATAGPLGAWTLNVRELGEYLEKLWLDLTEEQRAEVARGLSLTDKR